MAPRRQVLLVQDEMLEVLIVEDALAEVGYDTIRKSTLKETLEFAAAGIGNIEFAIINLTLRDGDGRRLLDDLRKLRPALPAIVTTGHEEAHVRRLFGDAQIPPILRKPYSRDELLATINSLRTNVN